MDGYAVAAQDTYGASASLPAYLEVVGEVPMGQAAAVSLDEAQCAIVHTGGMIPADADAVVMVEHTQRIGGAEGKMGKEGEGGNRQGAGADEPGWFLPVPEGIRRRQRIPVQAQGRGRAV